MLNKDVRRNKSLDLFVMITVLVAMLGGCGGGQSGAAPIVNPPTPSPPGNQTPYFPELRVLVLGQSISSNCNEHKYGEVANVFQIGKDGTVKPGKDPFEWADCDQGSMWMPLGRNLIDQKIVGKITFMPIGVAGSSVKEWQGGRGLDKLTQAIALINKYGLTFDYAFWHQGSADIGMSGDEYKQRLASVVSYVNSKVKISRWLIAVHSRCLGQFSPEIEQAQMTFGNAASASRYLGPNTNLLMTEYRMPDQCHLNELGQEEMARLWVQAIINSAK
jgi:hypothetical protein